MNWYLAKIIFRIICGEGDHKPQFDEQLRLVAAPDDEHAFNKARTIGRQEAHSFLNQQGKLVEWQFVDVAELYKITEMLDGAELFSRIQETDCANKYMELVHERAASIRLNSTHRHLQLL